MKEKVIEIIDHFEDIEKQFSTPEVIGNPELMKKTAQERSRLEPVVIKGREYIELIQQIEEVEEILPGDDEELIQLAKEELAELSTRKILMEEELKILLLPRNPNDDKSIIMEIRAGTGGEEAALFAADLFRMYSHYAENANLSLKILDVNETGIGGFKSITFSLNGEGAYGRLKFESGVHRVQRVPKTEASGRLHTSAATVAVLPEAEDADIEVRDEDLKIDTYRASGAGGQHVNKTESAIRITHLPTGLVVTCQDEKSQHKNRTAAMKVLRSRLLAAEEERLAQERAETRRSLVSTGDRSAKIRTYNFPQNRVTDHRINYTAHNLENMINGDLIPFIEQLQLAEQQEQLTGINTG
ncbi:MAG: peptide chain release factor 1 [Candidatus Marinimicrobia bacterium]|jgi:peptide chain release factor 1|nr:peptide chain release factor 1 [Candidatus Neomarinimicrobiota bacterium]